MKNFEKYADRFSLVIASGGIKKEYFDKYLSDLPIGFMSVKKLEEWLVSEYVEPIRLTKAEKVILESLDEKYKWIARYEKRLCLFDEKPIKSYGIWNLSSHSLNFYAFNHLFEFIRTTDDEPYEIAWLLENCEVIEE